MLGQVLTTLVGFSSLVAAVPTTPRHRHGQFNQTSFGNGAGALSALGQLAQVSQLGQLAQLAEADLLAQVQSQLLLSAELQSIKDNIRINSLRARYPTINMLLVTVTNVVDARNPASINNRYLLNQLLVDNGFADKQQVIMVTESQTYTVTATTATAADSATVTDSTTATDSATATLDLAGILSSAAAATPTPSSLTLPLVIGQGLGQRLGLGQGQGQIIQQQQTTITTFNPAAGIPLSFLNSPQSLLLPYDTAAPSSALIIEDPANIIYGNQNDLLVQGLSNLQTDCAAFGLGGNAFVGGAANLPLFSSLQQAISFQLTSISVGSAAQPIPPSILLAHPDLAAALGSSPVSFSVNSANTTTTTTTATTSEAAASATW